MAWSSKGAKRIFLSLFLLAACNSKSPSVLERRPMPAFELERLDGTRFSSKALAGKVALVDFWATWCQPCLEEIPFWNQLQKGYAERGFTVLGVTVQSGWASDIQSDIEKLKLEIKYPLVME